jgi:hypothetical protein
MRIVGEYEHEKTNQKDHKAQNACSQNLPFHIRNPITHGYPLPVKLNKQKHIHVWRVAHSKAFQTNDQTAQFGCPILESFFDSRVGTTNLNRSFQCNGDLLAVDSLAA